MNRILLTGLLILVFLSSFASESYGCPDPPDISLVYSQYHVSLEHFDTQNWFIQATCISGGPIDNWVWTCPTGSYVDQTDQDYKSTVELSFSTTGTYTISVKGYNGDLYGSDSLPFYVFEMDLDVSGVSDDDEEDPGKFLGEGDFVEISLAYEPSSLSPGYIELKIPYGGHNYTRVWSEDKGTLIIPNGRYLEKYYKMWLVGTVPSPLNVEGYSTGIAELWLFYSSSTDPDHPVYPCSTHGGDMVKFTIPWMKLEKVGSTIIEAANNYSENATIRVTAVDGNGQTYESFTGTVNIAEDTSGPGYVEIYSQNGGYLPSSVNITSGGTTTFVAKSLAGPKSSTSKPDDAKIITTNHDVYNEANCLSVHQWTNHLGQVHSKSDPTKAVYDWLETMIKDMWTTSGDLGTVLVLRPRNKVC